jgi:hypothetical protein
MEDQYLASIVRYVEGGGDPVKVSMALTSGVVATGFVRRAQFFASVSQQKAQAQYLAEMALVRQRGETTQDAGARHDAAASAHADRIKGVLDDADASGADAITLSDVTIAWSSGDGLTLPTMRVNPAAIAAWWLGNTATPFKGKKDSGAFFGVAIPLDL